MNYYLIDIEHPDIKLRHYRNSRGAEFIVSELNAKQGYDRYSFISDEDPVVVVQVSSSFNVDYLS